MTTSTKTSASIAADYRFRAWDVNNPLVQVDRTGAPALSLQVRHLAFPFVCDWTTNSPDIAGLLPIAHAYLEKVNARLGLLPHQLDALNPNGNPARSGTTLAWLTPASCDIHSHWLARDGGASDRTALLLAGMHLRRFGTSGYYFTRGGQGLRLLAQVSPVLNGRVVVRIAGVVSSVPPIPPNNLRTKPALRQFHSNLKAMVEASTSGLPTGVGLVDGGIELLVDMSRPSPGITGVILQAKTAVPPPSVAGTRQALPDTMQLTATSYKLTHRVDYPVTETQVRLQPLIAFASVPAHARVMASDPISLTGETHNGPFRPHRPSAAFAALRSRRPLDNLPDAGSHTVELENAHVRVRHVRLVDPPLLEDTPKIVPADSDAPVRSNTFAAVSAFHHVQAMFRRMQDHGLDIAAYFRFVDLPLDVHYRAGIVPAFGDGRTVNAQVRWLIGSNTAAATCPGTSLDVWNTPASKRRMELRFALGDLHMATGRLPPNLPAAREKHPLGVAADVRWCWHEFGHVLNAAATGDLELPFAHSVGDALAAVACDPASALACRPDGAADNAGAWRHVTFPWVFVPRRHDRDVLRGWSWSQMPYGVSAPHGYRSEQLMSTTMFRLYRALGGDCVQTTLGVAVPARVERDQAAQYTTYLIMRTLSAIGPANVTPCMSVHQFVHAMRTVDTITANTPGPGGYVGGSTNKVIQWAFEQQGLYGQPLPGSAVMGPDAQGPGGSRVDLHLDDRRVQSNGPYTPVNLLGDDWHAAAGVITVQPAWPGAWLRCVRVRIDNRGDQAATGTRIRLWTAACPAGSAIPPFPGAAWKRLWVLQGPQTVPGASASTPGRWQSWPVFWLPPGPGRYLVLLEASCAADRSNIDPATGFPCVTVSGPTHRLVAFDNNLALQVVEI